MDGVVLSLCILARGSPVLESAVTMVGYGLYGRSSGDLLQEDLCQHTTPPGTAALSPPDPVAGHVHPRFHQRLPKTHRTGILMKKKRHQRLTGLSLSLNPTLPLHQHIQRKRPGEHTVRRRSFYKLREASP